MSKKTYLIFAILFSALSIIYPAIILIQHPHGYVICTYIYTALTATSGALCWVGHAFKSNPQRTNKEHTEKCLDEIDRLKTANAEQKAEIERRTDILNQYMRSELVNEDVFTQQVKDIQQAVKYRTKEIFEKIFETLCCFTTQGKSKEYAEGFIDCLEEVDKRLQNLAKEKYSVEV